MLTAIFALAGLIIGLIAGYKICGNVYRKKPPFLAPIPEKVVESLHLPSVLEEKIRYESQMEYIFKLDEELSLTLDRGKVVQYITESAYNYLPVERAVLLLWDKDAQAFKIECALGMDINLSKAPTLKNEDSVSMLVMRQKEPLVVNNLEQDQYLNNLNREEYLKKSFVSVPIIFRGEALGVLHVCDRKTEEPFTKNDVSFAMNIARIGAIALNDTRLYEQLHSNYLKTITALALAVDARDSYTKHHSEHVSGYSVAVAQRLKCSKQQIELIQRSALLHDIGKIGVKDAILLKNGGLTPDEIEQIKLHPAKGEEIVEALPFLKETALLIRHHHEKYDGSGYPDGIKGDNIELGARILAVADSYDAMTTNRPYRNALSAEEALLRLEQGKGNQFDPKIVECFEEIIKEGFNPDSQSSESL